MRNCTKCGTCKEESLFGRDSSKVDGLSLQCKACHNERQRRWNAENREKRADYYRLWRANNFEKARSYNRKYAQRNKERQRAYALQRKYGVTPEQWQAMLEKQGHRCAICGVTEPRRKGQWVTDHCHESGQARGLLCHSCNAALGLLKENRQSALKMAEYIQERCEPLCERTSAKPSERAA